jgi:NAD(P)-dependent dehydrogenase (short-subunit alcohol dehydrogenase family)
MTNEIFNLDGKVSVVTGGARGLGKAAAMGLAAFRSDVVVIDILEDEMDKVKEEISRAGRKCRVYKCDVSDETQVCQTAQQITSDFGRVDILVNIAGITNRVPTTQITPEQVRKLTEVNYYGIFWCCKEFGKMMLKLGGGSIINMSALGGGILGMGRGNAAYCATKGAIAALTKDLAAEWGPKGIRVNAVAPSWFQTDMNVTSIFADSGFMNQVYTKLPMRRIGKPEDIVGPIVFLASDAARMITGLILPVDGGAASTCPIMMEGNG